MTTQAQTEIQNRFIKNLSWKVFSSIIVATISITGSVIMGFQSLKDEVKDTKVELRTEMKAFRYEIKSALDTVKFKQVLNKAEVDGKFQRMDDKLNTIQNNTDRH